MAAAAAKQMTRGTSPSLQEAKTHALQFFRECCRSLPLMMDMYNLDEVITMRELRSKVASQFRKHAEVANPKVIDMLVFKGKEELQNCVDHSKQRHHLIGEYVLEKGSLVAINKLGSGYEGESEFLNSFYRSNASS